MWGLYQNGPASTGVGIAGVGITGVGIAGVGIAGASHGRVAQSDRIGPRMRSLKSHMYDFLAVNTDQHRIICWNINYYM